MPLVGGLGASGPLAHLQRSAGNRAVAQLLGTAVPVVQRDDEEVYTLIHHLQGRLGSGAQNNAVVAAMLTEITAVANRPQPQQTRELLKSRVASIRDDLLTAEGLTPQTAAAIRTALDPIVSTGRPAQAAPALPPGLAAPQQGAQPTAPRPTTPAVAAAATSVALTKQMRAVDVLKAVEARQATVTGLQSKWFVSSIDRDKGKNCYSTAYNLGQGSKWEIHVHRRANGAGWVCTFQNAVAVGNTDATRGMPLDDMTKLEKLGIPKNHDPKKSHAMNRWGAL